MKLFSTALLTTLATAVMAKIEHKWWKEGVVYQVYPASFKDSNGDGWGDVRGIIDNLDHMKDLGVDIIWASPFYESPLTDMGYDIADYTAIKPLFGTMEEAEELIEQVHSRGMRILFDLVINHTSDKSKWFQESKSSKDNAKRDWYFWRPPQTVDGERYPPNNWSGTSDGSAWEWDETTQEYYLHVFNEYQPDLNWDNPEVREALFEDSMKFWLDKGVDGFRMDVYQLYSKVEGLPSVPANDTEFHDGSEMYNNGPNIHKYLNEMNQKVLSNYDCMTVGEGGTSNNMTQAQLYVGAHRNEINMEFLKQSTEIGRGPGMYTAPYTFAEWRDAIEFIQSVGRPENGDGWNTVFLENHDIPRSISKFGDDSPEFRVPSGKLLSVYLSTLSGTMYLYQGQEIGMINVPREWGIDEYRDQVGFDFYNEEKAKGVDESKIMDALHATGRDNARMPFNWDSGDGFSTNDTTWISECHKDINLKDQKDDPDSVYNFWKQMIKFRKDHKDLLNYGDFKWAETESEDFLCYYKSSGRQKALVVLNFSKQKKLAPVQVPNKTPAVATHPDSTGRAFEPFEARVYLL